MSAQVYPHERRVQAYGYLTGVAATVVALVLAFRGDAAAFGYALPAFLPAALVAIGGVLALVAVARRMSPMALAAATFLVVGVAAAAMPRPAALDWVLGIVFGGLVLATGELVDMTVRYETAHRAVEEEGVPEDHINRVTDEALKTLGQRTLVAAGVVAAAVIISLILSTAGPGVLRAAVETSGPLGVAIIGAAILIAIAFFVLVRGADFSRGEKKDPQETSLDVAE